jgi:D-alanyl-D-alanine carboxypeptidase/D-alanyl-D-alanine-endopeptidase (penicillin-binding protein 4)
MILKGTCKAKSEGPIGVTIHDPGMYAATVLAEVLSGAGIKIEGKVGRDRTVRSKLMEGKGAAGLAVLAVHETPIAAVLTRANKDSVNLYGESLCKRVGYAASGQSGSWENGSAAVGAFLKKVGAAEQQFHLDDGCGLSRKSMVSPHAMILVLEHVYYGKHRTDFVNSLAVGGWTGRWSGDFASRRCEGRCLPRRVTFRG